MSDTHVRNLKYHKEYKQVFQQIYDTLKIEKPDFIIHCGDIAHTKTQISPEFVDMTSDFFRNLAAIAPTYIILGNHDGNLRNSGRQDALSPIVDALNLPNLHLLKNSGEVQVREDLVFNVLSIFDEERWQKISDWRKINIALYHGSVSGVTTDQGFVLEHGDHPIEIFQGFDYALLGDIHKTNQILDVEGRIRYPGSTIQQNHGETNDKGFLIWEIKNKDDFDVRHISIPNPNPFITVELEPDGAIPEIAEVPDNSKLRLVSNTHISAQSLKKSIDIAKKRWKPESVTVHNRPGKRISVEEISNSFEEDNLRDLKIQEALIREYLKEYKLEQTIENKILELNKKYNLIAEQTEEVARNVNWKLKKIEWSNLFNFGETNSIDFTNLNGILGIFGKNYSGKSSTIDSILWTIFNSISKKARKNVDLINQNKNNCSAKIDLEIDNKIYTIERESTKYIKKLYGEETTEAKTLLNFSVEDVLTGEKENLNAEDRNGTDANIRKVFGTIDDFLLTSMTSQMGSMSFIEEGSTKRKEILGKFLDLEMFDKKFKLARDDSALLKGAIKRLEGKDFEKEIEASILNELETNKKIADTSIQSLNIKNIIEKYSKSLTEVETKIESGPKQEFIDIEKIQKSLENINESIQKAIGLEVSFGKQIKDLQKIVSETNEIVLKYNIDDLRKDKQSHEKFTRDLADFISNQKWFKKESDAKKQKIAILDDVPCGDTFPACRFLVDANKEKSSLPDFNLKFLHNEKEIIDIKQKMEVLKQSLNDVEIYQDTKQSLSEMQNNLIQLELNKEKNKNMFKNFENEKSILEAKKKAYFENEKWMKELGELETKKNSLKSSLKQAKESLFEARLISLYQERASFEQKKLLLEQQKQELSDLRDEYLAYDLFVRCMHSNGIVYDIIKKKLPIINQEIAKNLANIVNFEIFFEDDGKKLDIFIRHPKYESRPVELCSGAEKTIAAMAIRLALIKVSSLPIADIFILDEPATSLDEDNMEGFTRILEMIKSQFKTVILISHLDALKDVVDDQIIIEKIDGYAKINL